jgi:hypothetical protein
LGAAQASERNEYYSDAHAVSRRPPKREAGRQDARLR